MPRSGGSGRRPDRRAAARWVLEGGEVQPPVTRHDELAVENNVLAQLCHGVGEVGEAKPGEGNGAGARCSDADGHGIPAPWCERKVWGGDER
ncbi:hypothetical protein ACFWPU_19170 [Streptomyces sp. NPDC058471]|uniref:hypothetical protein n=1 Tax=Streptomyces sp. NPDC058471 TaxID=3346516 RepID=UPI00366A33EF